MVADAPAVAWCAAPRPAAASRPARFAVPTLANRVGGLAETIQDGVTGVLVEPTVAAWAEALRVVEDQAGLSRMGAAARERPGRRPAGE